MKIINISHLAIPDIKILRLERFMDKRGYFLEVFRTDILTTHPQLEKLKGKQFTQLNESSSSKGVIRGLHTQCRPNIDKLLRVLKGKIIDVVLDVRLGSPTFGHAVAYELSYDPNQPYEEIIFIPFGFAHGIVALENSHIQYFQTGLWNGEGETTIQFTDPLIDWSLCSLKLNQEIHKNFRKDLFSPKDQLGKTLDQWEKLALAQDSRFK